MQRTNAAVDREERNEAVEELKNRVEDWKGHKIEAFGELLLHGTFTVLKGESSAPKGNEREVNLGPVPSVNPLLTIATVQDFPIPNDFALLQGDRHH